MITKKIKHKDSTGVVHKYDIGADAKNISEDTTHRFVSDEEKEEWSRKMDPAGNASDSTVAFKQAASRENISTGEKMAGLFGKIAKWFADLKNHSFSDLIQNATTADSTRAVSAAVAKNLQDQITAQNTNKTISLSINDIASILSVTNLSACRNGGNVYVRIDAVTKEQFVGWTTILRGLPIPALPTYIQTPNAKIRVQDGALALSGAAKGTTIDTVISYPSIS